MSKRREAVGRTAVFTLLVAAAAATGARADLLTPGSITPPVPLSPAVEGSQVPVGGDVRAQYENLGLEFSHAPWQMTPVDAGDSTAVVSVNGVHVWTGATFMAPQPSQVSFAANVGVTAALVAPGTDTAAPTNSVTVKLVAAGGLGFADATVSAYDVHGTLLMSRTVEFQDGGSGTVAFTGAGIEAIHVSAVSVAGGSSSTTTTDGAPFTWGVAGIDIGSAATPPTQDAPEPPGFVLAALGTLGLIGYAWRRLPKG